MATYMVLWKANPTAWPTDPKQTLQIIETVSGGADMLIKSGAIKELGWFSAESGYGIIEAPSKDVVIGIAQPFFPLYTNEIHEIVPWEAGVQAMVNSARMAASR